MTKEERFLIYCLEVYKQHKGLTGEEVINLFDRHDLFSYVQTYYQALHTTSEQSIVQDIEEWMHRDSM